MKILVLANATDVWYTSFDSEGSSYNINYVDFYHHRKTICYRAYFSLYFHQQIHLFQLFSIMIEGFFQIDSCGLDIAMTQYARQLYDIMM